MDATGLKDYEIDYLRYIRKKHSIKARWDNEKKNVDLTYL